MGRSASPAGIVAGAACSRHDARHRQLSSGRGFSGSGDHRVHTGVEGLTFLNRVKTYLEAPMRLLRHTQKPEL